MVKQDNTKNITFNLGGIEGGKIKRGRKKKVIIMPTEVVIKEKLPHTKFSHKKNVALDQLLEANREREKIEVEKAIKKFVSGTGISGREDLRRNPIEDLPQFGDITLKLPPFFAVPSKKGWRLANPLTEMRNLANRKHQLSVDIKRSNVKKPELDMSAPREAPRIDDFSAKDQAKLKAYLKAVEEGRADEYLFKNKPRGFPATLYKNAKKAGLKETNEKVYTKNNVKTATKAETKVKCPTKAQLRAEVRAEERAEAKLEKQKMKSQGKGLNKCEGEGDKETTDDGDCDGEGSAGSLLGDIGKKAYHLLVKPKVEQTKRAIHRITHPKETIQEVKDFGRHLIQGRHDAYPPSAQKIIEANEEAIVESISLRRTPLSSAYTTILSWATKGETARRIKEQPKDTLYHIAMWVKLSNGKTIKVEKNEVINMVVNPNRPKEEQVFALTNVPANLTFGDMLSKTREAVGDNKFFSYSAKDNNCGNFIEYVLKTNGMNSEATHDYIGQDAKAILKGFPSLRKVMNTLTGTAGRANVLLEGGDILANPEEKKSPYSNIDMISHTGHPALASDLFPRIPQAFSQVHLAHPTPIGHGLYAGGSLLDKIYGGARKTLGVGMRMAPLEGGAIPSPPSRSPITDPSLLGSGLGSGMKKGRPAKGSAEAKAWGERMRALRKK